MNFSIARLIPCMLVFAALNIQAQEASSITPVESPTIPLFPNDSLEGWQLQNTEAEFFRMNDAVLRVTGDRGWAQSIRQYGDFTLTGEFRFLEPDSDSGIFLRVEPGTEFIRGWPGDAYQVQIREISANDSDNPLPLLNLYRHRVPQGETTYQRDRVFEIYGGVGEWQTLAINVESDTIEASLNGELVLSAQGVVNPRGHIGFQSEKGTIEYRNMRIHEH